MDNEKHYRELFETSRDGIAHLNMEGRFVDCNPAFLDFLGYQSVESLRGLGFSDLTPPEYLPLDAQIIQQTNERGYSEAAERECFRRDGGRVPTRIRAWLRRDANGVPIGTWVVLQDLREHRQAEADVLRLTEQLFHSQKMEAIGRLAGGIAHDFNNLLTTIIGYTDLMMRVTAADALITEGVREIDKAAMRAAALVRQLLAFSRRQQLSPQVVDLNGLIENLKRMLERLIGEDIALLVDLDVDTGRIKADPGQIEQVIINLAVNAKDAMPQGGRILIRTRKVVLDDAAGRDHADVQPGAYVVLTISDNGSGMDENVKAHLFEPFFTTKEKGKGTGLGLSTVYGIVRQSGGHVSVYSEMGKGSSFEIHFPSQGGGAAPARLEASPVLPTGGTETILLVEDEPQLLAISATMLRKLGYRVIENQNAGEALALVESEEGAAVDLLLSDVVMPEMSGRVLADRIASVRPDIKVLFVSGYNDDAVLDYGITSSEICFLKKPFSLAELDLKIRETLAGK